MYIDFSGEGIRIATEQQNERYGARPQHIAKKVILVFTDGWTNKGPDPETMSKEAKRAGFTVYSVGYEVENLLHFFLFFFLFCLSLH